MTNSRLIKQVKNVCFFSLTEYCDIYLIDFNFSKIFKNSHEYTVNQLVVEIVLVALEQSMQQYENHRIVLVIYPNFDSNDPRKHNHLRLFSMLTKKNNFTNNIKTIVCNYFETVANTCHVSRLITF